MDRLDESRSSCASWRSLARAAVRLRRSPPAVTRAGGTGRPPRRAAGRPHDAPAGADRGRPRLLRQGARGLTADYEAATAGARDAPVRGLLRITAPVQFGRRHIALPWRFLDAQAGVEVELLLADRNIDLSDEGIDVALRIGRLGWIRRCRRAWWATCAARGGKPGLFPLRHAADAGRPGGSRGDPGNGVRANRESGASPACAPRRA